MCKFLAIILLAAAQAWAAGELSSRRAPGFSLPDINFKQHDLVDYRGMVVLLEIMATTCPHCVKFGRTLEEISRKYAGRVQVLSIVNPPDVPATVGKFAKDNAISYPVLFDCGQAAGAYMKATPQKSSFDIPHLFIIDPNGYIKNDYAYGILTTGIFEGRDLFKEVEKLLGGSAAPQSAPKK